MMAAVDGFDGEIVFETSEEICSRAWNRIREETEKQQILQEMKGKENITLDGRKVNIYANIGSVSDIGYALENDAGGVGLF